MCVKAWMRRAIFLKKETITCDDGSENVKEIIYPVTASKRKNEYNIDLENFNPEIGVYQGDATLMEGIVDGSQSTIYFENPYNYYPINENSIRVLDSNGKMEIIGSPSNKYVNHTPQYCEEFGLNYELSEIQNVGQYTRSNGTVISPETTPTFLHYTVTKP